MAISCSTSQKEEKECTGVNYLIYAVLLRFQISRNLRIFPLNLYSKIQSSQKKVFFLVCTKVPEYPLDGVFLDATV